jgi:hypothetical protein
MGESFRLAAEAIKIESSLNSGSLKIQWLQRETVLLIYLPVVCCSVSYQSGAATCTQTAGRLPLF